MKIKTPATILILLSPFIVAVLSLFVGSYAIPPGKVISILGSLFHGPAGMPDIPERAVLMDIRIPRIALASLVGASLSISGATLQGIFRNPLVDPYILGISAGSAFGCALSIGFFPHVPIQLLSLVFGIVSVVISYYIARGQDGISNLSLILSGVIVSSFFTALVSIIKFLVDPHKLQNIVYWLMGSFSLADWRGVRIAAAGITLGVIPLLLMRWRLNVLSMGEDEARSLGVDAGRSRLVFIGLATFIVSLSVSLSGIIGWIGLIVPHLLRILTGPDHKSLIPLCITGGAAFMIASDTVARNISQYDIPIGVITAALGAPFFVYLMKKGGRGSFGQ